MHDSSVMPFIHLGLIAAVLLAFLAFVVIKKVQDRKASRRRDTEAHEVEEQTHG